MTQASLRSVIAVVPQEPILFHRSIRENIAYARPEATLAEIEAAARRARADGFIARLPKRYDTLMAGRTTIVIAHRLSTVRSADRILVFQDGRVVEEGRHADLVARGGAYARLSSVANA